MRGRLTAWSILVAMILVVTPRGYLHHCELAHHVLGAHGATAKADCPVCDEVAPVPVLPAAVLAPTPGSPLEPMRPAAITDPFLGHVLFASDRGPPACA